MQLSEEAHAKRITWTGRKAKGRGGRWACTQRGEHVEGQGAKQMGEETGRWARRQADGRASSAAEKAHGQVVEQVSGRAGKRPSKKMGEEGLG